MPAPPTRLAIAGIIEGFYGRPWSWDERLSVAAECAGWGLRDYVYAPKDDPKHRAEWRAPYDDAELDGFARFAAAGHLRLGFGISPGLSLDAGSGSDLAALTAKVGQVLDAGAEVVALCFDDIPFGGAEQGAAHGRVAAGLAEAVAGRAELVVVPTEYVGIRSTPYLAALTGYLPEEVLIGWTGDAVVNDAITARQAKLRADALGGRPPLVWDNLPVNDGLMADRLHLGPLWGRDEALLDGAVSGWLANPMVQPKASLLSLASMAAWLRGDDPLDAWASEADRRGWRVFAEACDGAVPHALVSLAADAFASGKLRVGDLEPLHAWFGDAAEATAPGLESECAGWLEQVHAEADVAVAALDLLEAALDGSGADDLVRHAFVMAFRWKGLQRAEVAVMGPRLGFRPMLGQAGDGGWALRRASLIEGTNAVDALCRLAFDAVAWSGEQP